LAAICYKSWLFDCVEHHPGNFAAYGQLNKQTVAGFVESVIGAAYMTAGMKAVEIVLINLGIVPIQDA